MNSILLSLCSSLCAGLLLLSCSSNGDSPEAGDRKGEGAEPPFATSLLLQKKPESVSQVDIEIMESAPLQFALNFGLQAPTPGYSPKLGTLETKGNTLRLRLDLVPPDGPSLTVLDQVQVRIPLGSLRAGSWFLEVPVYKGNKRTTTLHFTLEAKQ